MIDELSDVSRETFEILEAFQAELLKWNKSINLVSKGSTSDIWMRHLIDSAQIYKHITPEAKKLVDIGSGGGLPGLVLAIMAKGQQIERSHILIESDQRKCAFLTYNVQKFDLDVDVISKRSENTDTQQADILTCRGFAPLNTALSHINRHMKPDGDALLLKGASHQSEVDDAKQNWRFTLDVFPSITQPQAAILKIREIEAK